MIPRRWVNGSNRVARSVAALGCVCQRYDAAGDGIADLAHMA